MEYVVDTIELRKAMLDSGIVTIQDFVKASGVSDVTLGGILSGKIRPSTGVIEKIAKTLSLDGDDIARIFFKQKLA